MDTSGYKGWWPVKFFEGKKDGKMTGSEGFRNVVNGEECQPEKGWDGEPPYPTGELSNVRHVSDAYRHGYDRIQWER
jgi:hypothetical protein